MKNHFIYSLNHVLTGIPIPPELNNPFSSKVPDLAQLASKEFQEFITEESKKWNYDFSTQKGKMFGVLVVQLEENSLAYLGTVSGKLPNNVHCDKFVPSVFDDKVEDNFIGKGMRALSALSDKINQTKDSEKVIQLKAERASMSYGLQQKLFENYSFLNIKGELKNVIEIFSDSGNGYPPTAAGECAAPKLLHYALENNFKPIAIAEFWWGNSPKNKGKVDKAFYPACKNRCRPILEFMLNNNELYDSKEC